MRHPKPICEEGLCYGRIDLECDPEALGIAAANLSGLAAGHRIFTSPARRALALAKRLGTEVAIEPLLQELHFGNWEGRLWQDIGRDTIEAWQRGLPDSAPPDGETLSAMASRCAGWLNGLEHEGAPILAITHAGPIRVIRALLGGEPLLTHFGASVPFASPIALEVERKIGTSGDLDETN